MIVAKFGGSSLSEGQQFKKIRDIIQDDPRRRYIVVSAPGKRFPADEKVTDLLLACYKNAALNLPFDVEYGKIVSRFQEISEKLGIKGCLDRELSAVREKISAHSSRAYVASRGEYLCGLLLSAWLSLPFIDAAGVIRFSTDGKIDSETTLKLLHDALLQHERAILPGFYGADSRGNIHVFSRGGSDITGALAASAADADLYENWTDVCGFRSADPRIVPDASYISALTYRELRELSYMGATVMHEDAIFPVRQAGIPTSIRNTNDPLHPGTTIQYSTRHLAKVPTVTGIAGKRGFSVVILEKNQMNNEVGFGRKVLAVFERHQLNFEHLPTGIDTMCVMVPTSAVKGKIEQITLEIEEAVHPDTLTVQGGIALLACVGAGIFRQHGTTARLFTALAEQGISIRTMFQAPSELSIIIGISENRLDDAVRAVYDAFIRI